MSAQALIKYLSCGEDIGVDGKHTYNQFGPDRMLSSITSVVSENCVFVLIVVSQIGSNYLAYG